MKYKVHVKEIWERSYLVEANSKAHAKTIAHEQSKKDSNKRPSQASFWGLVGQETWTVYEVK